MANAALTNGSVNVWTVLLTSMLALMPPFERRLRPVRSRAAEPAPVAPVGALPWPL
jgi:hypothetical protein